MLQLAQLPKCLLKEAVAYKHSHQCRHAYLGPHRCPTSSALLLEFLGKWRRKQPPHLLPGLLNLGNLPGNLVGLSMRNEYCKGCRWCCRLFHAHVCTPIPNEYLLGFCNMSALCEGSNHVQDTYSLLQLGNTKSRKISYLYTKTWSQVKSFQIQDEDQVMTCELSTFCFAAC